MTETFTLSEKEALISSIDECRKSLYKSLYEYFAKQRDSLIETPIVYNTWMNRRMLHESARMRFLQNVQHLEKIFEDFHIINENTINYGSVKHGNFRVCEYGNTDGFKNSIWIHTNSLKELIHDCRIHDKAIISIYDKYVSELKRFYALSRTKK